MSRGHLRIYCGLVCCVRLRIWQLVHSRFKRVFNLKLFVNQRERNSRMKQKGQPSPFGILYRVATRTVWLAIESGLEIKYSCLCRLNSYICRLFHRKSLIAKTLKSATKEILETQSPIFRKIRRMCL